jgi:Secretion system C-terminal sorting domain
MTKMSRILTSIIPVFFSINIYSQSIIAGVTPLQGTFFDIIPDTTLISVQNWTNQQYNIDINKDSIPDFQIYTWNYGGMGGGSSSMQIKSYDSNEIAYSHFDTCFAGPFNFPLGATPMAKAYNNNDTISSTELWTKYDCSLNYGRSGVYFDSLGNGNYYYCSSTNFSSLTNFIGIRTISNDTTYGWIQVKDITNGGGTIQAYASTHYSTGISEDIDYLSIQAYPNPCAQILYVSLEKPQYYSGTIEIYNNIGILEFRELFVEGKAKINLQKLQNGMYILVLKTNDKYFRARFQKID